MEYLGTYLMAIVETGGIFAPVLFIGFHLLRPLFFLPVVFICISGGILFGVVAGTIYSIVGITLSSIVFYQVIRWVPKTFDKLVRMKHKLIGKNASFTTSQVAVLRLIPFIHFHLLSLCILEVSYSFKDYLRNSFYSNIPLAVVYTSIGKWISTLSPLLITALLLALIPLFYILRKKEISMKWDEFFQAST
ncbi:VTT domain-containing protein [Aquibacillus sp. 3ASR75-11]|uniref:TVP38/TMEM64 family membrane protein n=1 Tax=Terrihalobacillus insolitus TaxID=2950438 RepID=A0A9X3WQI7_9BACI|nr:VTT domain-containing protein [Terrihalobacillus insolitus]MDC3412599.1 VTT domain-containing protein [Terrihalobacillus insolitus]MDC3423950.1 VTT domain-containing protein [Terrihalobacillus insolitus]